MKDALIRVGGGLLAVIALAAVFIWWESSSKPDSTQGVSVIGDNLARLPQGEVFVLTRKSKAWSFTYDGSRVTVQAPALRTNPDPITLCGVNCKVDISMSNLGFWDFTMWQQVDGTVAIKWPNGWTYRSY